MDNTLNPLREDLLVCLSTGLIEWAAGSPLLGWSQHSSLGEVRGVSVWQFDSYLSLT